MAVSKMNRKLVLHRDNYKCVKCGRETELTMDHVIPTSKGGTNRMENLRTLCKSCNMVKGNYHPSMKDRLFNWLITRREINTIQNEILGAVASRDTVLKNEIIREMNSFLKEDGRKIDIKLVGMDNKANATLKIEQAKSERLLEVIYLLADRVEALEKYHRIEFIESEVKEYRSI